MTNNAQPKNTPKTGANDDYAAMSSAVLRTLRDSFTEALVPMQDKINELNRHINAAERREEQERREENVRALVPENASLNDHNFVFLINDSKEGGQKREEGGFLSLAVGAAYETSARLLDAKVDKKAVTAKFWSTTYKDLRLSTQFQGQDFDAQQDVKHEFLPAAKKVLEMSTPDNVAGKTQHYVIICEGTVSDNEKQAVAVLDAAAGLDGKATFDFVVCNAAETNMDRLVKDFKGTENGKGANLIKVGKAQDISAAVTAALKARLEGKVYDAPAPQAPAQKISKSSAGPTA